MSETTGPPIESIQPLPEQNGHFPLPSDDFDMQQAAGHAQNLIEKPGYSVHADAAALSPSFSSPDTPFIDRDKERGIDSLSKADVVTHEHKIIDYLTDQNTGLKDKYQNLAQDNEQLKVEAVQESERRDRREADQHRLAITDKLTQVNNREGLEEAYTELQSKLRGRRRSDNGDALLIVDLDHFKNVNDTYGHPVGDKVLTRSAAQIVAAVREGDIIGRWGGEEFLVILPNTDPEIAKIVAERIRESIATASPSDEIPTSVTASVGVGELDINRGLEANVDPADKALYQAKRQGRNRIISLYNEAV